MDSRSQSDSDGGGGRSPAPHDEGRLQPGASDGPTDPGIHGGQPRSSPVLSLDQIRITGSSNEYTEGPAAAQRSPATPQRPQKSEPASPSGARSGGQRETRDERPAGLHGLNPLTQRGNPEETLSSIRSSLGSGGSAQRLLGGEPVIRTQPKRCEQNPEELKALNEASRPVTAVPGSGAAAKGPRIHSTRCEDCGRCQCPECRRPRSLPSCWMCGRRCVCSAQSAVEYGTCVCCIKGLFYHCSSDDEDTCADKPFSCTQSHCCVRWTAVTLLSLAFPCVLCYLPARGCAAACQRCYDRAARPGCRCQNSDPVRHGGAGKPT